MRAAKWTMRFSCRLPPLFGRGQLPDLLRDLLELSRQLSEPDHPLTCDSSPDLPLAGEQASGPIQVSLRCQPVG